MVELEVDKANTAKTQTEANLCRLCLKQDDFVIDIFENQLDEDLKKVSLAKRLFDLFQINYEKSNNLPNSICQRCLYMVEAFTSFRENVRKCELELNKRSMVLQKATSKFAIVTEASRPGLNGNPGVFEPEEDCIITVVDPNQEYESSDDDFSMESDSEVEDPPAAPQAIVATSLTTAPEVPATCKTNISPKSAEVTTDNSNQQQMPYSAPALETLAMEFTRNTFLCQYCDMAFTTHWDCAEHETRHDSANPFICNFCPFRTSNRQNLIYHIKEMHDNERPYVCALCNKGFCRRSDLKKHTIVHTGVRPFTCPVCAKSFSRNTNLTKHMRIHSGVKPHVCQKCPRSFTTAAELQRHSRSHAEVKPYQCGKCPASFTRKDKLQLHQQAHFRKESEFLMNQAKVISTTDGQHRSTSGPQTENIIVSLNPYADVNTQLDANYFPQDLNSQRLAFSAHGSESAASSAASTAQHRSQFQGASFADDLYKHSILAAQLQQNRQTGRNTPTTGFPQGGDKPKVMPKSNSRNITCEICAKTFTRERDLQRHRALHLDKLFSCKECGRGFNRREKLVRHEQEHHKPQYTCEHCRITFSKPEALKMHMKVHELQHNMAMTQMALTAATSGSSGDSTAVGELLHQRLTQQTASASDLSFYSQMVPTMNLGFYSETRPEDRNGV